MSPGSGRVGCEPLTVFFFFAGCDGRREAPTTFFISLVLVVVKSEIPRCSLFRWFTGRKKPPMAFAFD